MKDISMLINSIKARTTEVQRNNFETFGIFPGIKFIVNIRIEGYFLYLNISYNETNSDSHTHKDFEIGGLKTIQNEIRNFGGDLLYLEKNDTNGFFNLTFKYVIYEQV